MVATPGNALNITASGYVVFDGTATFTGRTFQAGSGISLTNASGTAGNTTIATTGSIVGTWTDEATNFNAAKNNGYFVTATATATLPASPAQGDTIAFAVDSASGILTITANTGQTIQIGKAKSASAGTAASNFNGDSVTLVYRSTDTNWIATQVIGTFTVT
jgi:hypothetical protein